MIWTPEREAELTRLWTDGVKVIDIATQFGVTKSTIIGRAHRLRLAKHTGANVELTRADDDADLRCLELMDRGLSGRAAAKKAGIPAARAYRLADEIRALDAEGRA